MLETLAHVRELVESVSFARNIAPVLGVTDEPVTVVPLYSSRDLERGFFVPPGSATSEGWKVTWHFRKVDRDEAPAGFSYTVSVFIPIRQARLRALESILDRFRVFFEHELREGLLVAGERVFDPHRGET